MTGWIWTAASVVILLPILFLGAVVLVGIGIHLLAKLKRRRLGPAKTFSYAGRPLGLGCDYGVNEVMEGGLIIRAYGQWQGDRFRQGDYLVLPLNRADPHSIATTRYKIADIKWPEDPGTRWTALLSHAPRPKDQVEVPRILNLKGEGDGQDHD